MKKLAVFVAAIALTLGLAQCKKEQTPTGTGETVRITLNVDGGNNGAKVNVNPNAVEQITFENGDQILVASGGKYVGTLTCTDGTFSGEITDPVEGKPLFFYFLGNKQDDNSLTAGTTTTCTVNISDQTTSTGLPVISMGRSVAPNALNQSVNYSSDINSYTARLYNRCSLMKFNVTTTSTNSTAPICILGLNNEVTVNFADPTDSGFTYGMSKQDCGLIKMAALDAQGVTWAIVLPQDNTKTACCYTDEALESSYCGSFPLMSIGSNHLYDGEEAVTLDITTTRKVDLSAITTPNSGNTDYNVQSGQVLTGELQEDGDGSFMPTLDGSYRICIVDNATVTLSGVTIHRNAEPQMIPWAGLTCLGDATIILEGNNTVNAFYYQCPGILPGPTDKTLTIKGSGKLSAQSKYFEANTQSGNIPQPGGAGIGCGAFDNPSYQEYKNTIRGNIRIESGEITATGGFYAAGIGTAGAGYVNNAISPSTCGDITITGGTIVATGGIQAAGIGTGYSTARAYEGIGATSTCEDITISGGHIEATGGFKAEDSHYTGLNNAAGIGAGSQGYCHSIAIEGSSSGTATSVGDYYSIGGRGYCFNSFTFFGHSVPLETFGSSYSWQPPVQ